MADEFYFDDTATNSILQLLKRFIIIPFRKRQPSELRISPEQTSVYARVQFAEGRRKSTKFTCKLQVQMQTCVLRGRRRKRKDD